MKTFAFILMVFISVNSFAQKKSFEDPIYGESTYKSKKDISSNGQISLEPITIGLHTNYFNVDTRNSPHNGIGFSLSFNRLYMDLASNLTAGKGEYLEFSSQYTYDTNKCAVGVFNLGYIIPVNNFSFIPFLGYGYSQPIYQDPVGWDTFYKGESNSKVSIGLIGSIKLSYNIRIQAGVGTFETFKAGLSYCSF